MRQQVPDGSKGLRLGGGPGRLARTYAATVRRLRWPIVIAWIVGAVAAVVYLPGLENQKSASASGLLASNPTSIATQIESYRIFGTTPTAETAIVQHDDECLSDAAQRRLVDRAVLIRDRKDPAFKDVLAAVPIFNSEEGPFSREECTTAVTYMFFEPTLFIGQQKFLADEFAKKYISEPDDKFVGVTGPIPARVEQERTINRSLPLVTGATVALIALALALTLRSLLAPIVTLVAAGVAYALAGRAIVALGEVTGAVVPREIEPLIVVLLLGIVTDYCIFYLSDMRARLLEDATPIRAAEASTARMTPIVLTAGLIVAAGTATLVVGTMGFFKALGPGMAVTALIGVAVSMTFVPALMAILGRAMFWPGVSERARYRRAERLAENRRPHGPIRHGLAVLTARRPSAVVLAALCIGLLGFGAWQAKDIRLGLNLVEGLPKTSEARIASDAASEGFATGILSPTEILLKAPGITEQQEALTRLQELVEQRPRIAGVLGPREAASLEQEVTEVESAGDAATTAQAEAATEPALEATLAPDGNAARMIVVLEDDPFESAAIEDVNTLRDDMPGLLREAGLDGVAVGFAGQTALAAETVQEAQDNVVRLAIAALVVNFLFLVVFLRAIIAPLYLLAASVLALAATLGLTAFVFQDLLGYGQLAYYIPFAASVLLLSLGSDYNIFIVGRIWDELRKRDVESALEKAAPEAAGPITLAGLVLAGSFALLALIPLTPFREFAFVMAVGVLIDSFVVRSLLAPSLIRLFSRQSARHRRLDVARSTSGAD